MKCLLYILTILFLLPCVLHAQQLTRFDGKVTDKTNNEPLAGVTISTAGANEKPLAITDNAGKFSISVAQGTDLKFSYVNYTFRIIKATAAGLAAVSMEQKAAKVENEVVVQGFVKKSRATVTGASTVISGKQIQDVPTPSLEGLLQGKVAGMNIQNNSGSPGIRGTILVRGLSSISTSGTGANAILTPTSPLFVIDGVPLDLNSNFQYGSSSGGPGISPLALIPVEDIEQVEVLKDAASTALWGSRGAYGVIIVTTKRGKSLTPILNYSGQFFYSGLPHLRDVIGGKGERHTRINQVIDFDTSYSRSLQNINNTTYLSDSLNPFYNNSVNWQSKFFRPTYNYSSNLNVSGGTQQFSYKVNLGYYSQKGIIENTGLTRYSLSTNMSYRTSKITINAYLNSSLAQNQNGSGNGLFQSGVASGASASSFLPPPSAFSDNNSTAANIAVEDDNKTVFITPDVNINWSPIKGLQLFSDVNFSLNSGTSTNFRPSTINGGKSRFTTNNLRRNSLYNRNQISYNRSIKKRGEAVHNFNIMGFTELQINSYQQNQYVLPGSPNDQLYNPTGYDWFRARAGTLNDLSENRNVAYGGLFSYNYKLKYVFDFQYRTDGSSTNGPKSGYKKSPNLSLRWNMHKESWFNNWNWLNSSALRASYGTTLIPTGTIFDVYGKFVPGSNYNGGTTILSDLEYIPNVNYKSFTNTSFDIGYEGDFFNNRLSVVYDFYYNSKDNQPFSSPLANTTGFQRITTNDVSMVSYGNELTLTFRSKQGGKFSWDISANASLNRDVLTKLPDNLREFQVRDGSGRFPLLYRIGNHPLTTLSYNTVGIYSSTDDVQVDPLTGRRIQVRGLFLQGGDPRWTDLNGDYVIDENDLLTLNDPIPKVVGGMSINLRYLQWSLNTNISATLFRDVVNTTLADKFRNFYDPLNVNLSQNGVLVPIGKYDYWRNQGDNPAYPNPLNYRTNNTVDPFRYNQTLFFEDGSYWKLNNVTISYALKSEVAKRHGLSSARVYVTAANVLILTRYSGSSPENVTDLGFDNSGGYPNPKNYTIGVRLDF